MTRPVPLWVRALAFAVTLLAAAGLVIFVLEAML